MDEITLDSRRLATLMAVVTALLIREGGRVSLSPAEWDAAVDHEGSLFIHRDDLETPMTIALLNKVADA